MRSFIHKDFLLDNEWGKKLYHSVAAALPVIDPHNHIDPAVLASDKHFENIYQLWVQHDPYKHRAMRICGIEEELITGTRTDKEKFLAWAMCFPKTVGGPLFHWGSQELSVVFGVTEILNPSTAENIWTKCNEVIAGDDFSAMALLKRFNVETLCTSDDLTDSLEHHARLAGNTYQITCLPSLRADSCITFQSTSFLSWMDKLVNPGDRIIDLHSYKKVIEHRLDFFDRHGCLLSDHSLDSGFRYIQTDDNTAEDIFNKLLQGEILNAEEIVALQSNVLHFLGRSYAERNWKMQLHIGAFRNTSTVLRNKTGAAGGYAAIGNSVDVSSLCRFLDDLDIAGRLPKTILYTLNPADNPVMATLTGSYAEDGVMGKVQFGPAWWYNDHLEGIKDNLIALSNYGLLAVSLGMTTDSRSLLSFVRHDYFRRVLCNLVGEWVEKNYLPEDNDLLTDLVKNISYANIRSWIKK